MQLYNTEHGIATYLTSLAGLHRLVADRTDAGYNRREPLKEFVVLGTWVADACGNFMRITEPTGLRGSMPAVLLRDELFARRPGLRLTSTMAGCVPPPHVVCGHCKKPWTIVDCHDAVAKTDSETIALPMYVGWPLSAVREAFKVRTDARYMLAYERPIRSDRFIDLRTDPKWPDIPLNKCGWVGAKEGIDASYIVQAGDEAGVDKWIYFHRACNRRFMEEGDVGYYREIMEAAGLTGSITPIKNGYCPCEVCGPWVEAQTQLGKVTIGRRKRVINIEWPETIDMTQAFEDQVVTKGRHFIHAWSRDKAVEYLSKLRLSAETVA